MFIPERDFQLRWHVRFMFRTLKNENMIKFTSDLSTFCIYVAGKNVENDIF